MNNQSYITIRNDIDKIITYNFDDSYILNQTDIDNPKSKLWKKIIEREKIDTSKIEQHLVINPKISNLDEKELFAIFKDCCAKFYRKYLGKNFNQMKDKQIQVYIVVEYGRLYSLSHIKDTHFHIILKTDNQDMLDKFHTFMENILREKLKSDLDYQYKVIDTPEYRINVYNYLGKENRMVWTNNELYNRKQPIDKLN